jgi:hypothetical protein
MSIRKQKTAKQKGKALSSLSSISEHNQTQNITKGLQRNNTSGTNVAALEQGLERLADGFVCGARQQSQQAALALEQAAQDARDGKRPVAMWHGGKNLGGEFFGKEHGALGLATGAEISGAARECDEVFRVALWTTDASETSFQAAAA